VLSELGVDVGLQIGDRAEAAAAAALVPAGKVVNAMLENYATHISFPGC
jgi:hypothetical protein